MSKEIQFNSSEFKKMSPKEKLEVVTEALKKQIIEDDGYRVLGESQKDIIDNMKERYPDYPISTIPTWIKQVYPGKNVKTYLIEQGIVQSVREYCISKIEHIDTLNLSKDKLFLEADDPDIKLLLQVKGKTRALVTGVWSSKTDGSYYVLDADDKDPMKGEYWDTLYLINPEKKLKFISKNNVIEILDKNSKKSGKASPGTGKTAKSSSAKTTGNPIEDFCMETFNPSLNEMFLKKQKMSDKLFKTVKYKDSDQTAPTFVVECAVVPYMQQLMTAPTKIGNYEIDYSVFSIDKNADKVAEALDPVSFGEMLDKLLGKDIPSVHHTLVPYGRFATGKQISGLVTRMNKWKKWDEYSAAGRKSIIIARGAILLNDSREAMLYIDKSNILDKYAKLRGLDPDVLRDNTMSDFGLDENGKKSFDLGNTTIEVSVNKELKPELFDTNAGKIVKSIPKRGADEKKYEEAKAEFDDIKKNLKEIIKNRKELLFMSFLYGTTRKPDSWTSSYLNNYILHRIAELVVWNQKGKTFTLTETGIVDCSGNEYQINDKDPINVAHPMQMSAGERKAWQLYFTSRGLKQPFEQVWEPVIDFANLKFNRFEGRMIPYYKFLKKEKEGIFVRDYDFHNDINISFSDCDANVVRVDWERHHIDMNHRFEVKSIEIKRQSKLANHIIVLLDKFTSIDRIMADDVTIADTLNDCSLAQITDYINLANENNANNVLALLMDYKKENFAGFDPMDEFVLD